MKQICVMLVAIVLIANHGHAEVAHDIGVISVQKINGELRLSESFENTNFSSRGWYDGATTAIRNSGYKGNCLEWYWQRGRSVPNNVSTMRKTFNASDEILIRKYVKFDKNWRGHQQSYGGPHLFHLLTNSDGNYAGLASSHLTTYIEFFSGLSNPYPIYLELKIQDSRNINTNTTLPNNITNLTEKRAVAGCNGTLGDGGDVVSCYRSGSSWMNGRNWTSGTAVPKGEWVLLETYLKMNSISGGVAQADGIMRQRVNGKTVQESTSVVYRTGASPNKKWNQFVLAPFMGSSPIDQAMWVDELEIYDLSVKSEDPILPPPSYIRIVE